MLRRFLHKPQAQWSTRDQVVAELVRVAERIPTDELPDADARQALIEAIRAGQVIGVYTPRSYARHNIELAGCPRDMDPRISAEQFTAYWRAGRTGASVVEQHIATQRAMQRQAQDSAQQGGDE